MLLLFVLVISSAWTKSGFCRLFWLYPESERRVSFVVCFGYIQCLNEEWVLSFVLVISRVWTKSELCCLFWLYPESKLRVGLFVWFWFCNTNTLPLLHIIIHFVGQHHTSWISIHLSIVMAIFKDFMLCVNTPSHSQIVLIFQFAD
jgi:hypothetical protein